MPVKVITDSTSDIPEALADELDIAVVPIYVRFGQETFRDGLDISPGQLYSRLTTTEAHPATSQPNPEDFITVFRKHSGDAEGIVSIHISSKISGTFNSASMARKSLDSSFPIVVIDSKFNSAGLGLVVRSAARKAKAGGSFAEVVAEAERAIAETKMFGLFKTMKYLARSGRVNKTIAAASHFLNVMPLLTFHDGEITRAGLVRSLSRGIDRIIDFVRHNLPVTELSIVHSQVPDEAARLKQRLTEFIEDKLITVSEMGAGLGVHGGPGVLLVAVRTGGSQE
ncbi:DegV family protein [Dehalogenimonas sp. THU2]|uniref:DegV family protein n=1 Tax=Dehalogenimonas sp. THU2 TaxID=3151121 RepID=UPI003218A184